MYRAQPLPAGAEAEGSKETQSVPLGTLVVVDGACEEVWVDDEVADEGMDVL